MKASLTKLAAMLAVTLSSAAAQAAPHDDKVVSGQAAIINAVMEGAPVYAAAELKMAREALDLARRAVAQNNFAGAMRLAVQAAEAARAAEARALEQRGFKTASR